MGRNLRRVLVMVLATVIFGVLAIGGFFYFIQDHVIYLPQAYARQPERILSQELRAGRQSRLLSFQTSQGQQQAIYFGKERPEKVWLMFGGNGARALDWLSIIHQVPVSVDVGYLLVDYPGYGWCEGKADPEAIQENVVGAVAMLADEWGVSVSDLQMSVSCMGHSLGAAVALEAGARMKVREVVVISAFTSMQAMADQVVGRPISFLLRHRFDNVKSLQRLQQAGGVKVVMFHGEEDGIVPVSMGQSLGHQFADLVTFHPVPQAGHNDILSFIDADIIKLLGAR